MASGGDVETTRSRVSGVDGVRALAASAVFFCHIGGYWPTTRHLPKLLRDLLATGAHGVDIFVVVSGFCLALAVAPNDQTLDVPRFWYRRFLRLGPPYYVALLIASTLAMVPGTWPHVVASQATTADVLRHAIFVQNFFPSSLGSINGSLWSICLEMQLYLLFPATVWCCRRFGTARCAIATSSLSVLWIASANIVESPLIGSHYLLPARLGQFVVGMWCAERVRSRRTPQRRHSLFVGVVSGLLAIAVSTADISALTPLVWSVPAVALLFLAAQVDEARPIARGLTWLGGLSYSFYLIHQPTILMSWLLVNRATSSVTIQFGVLSFIVFAVTIVLAYPLHRWVEIPSQRRGRRLPATHRLLPLPLSQTSGVQVRPPQA